MRSASDRKRGGVRGRIRLLLLLAFATLTASLALETGLWLSGRVRYPEEERREAWLALARSRASGAASWAPEEMLRAETAFQAALRETESQNRRWQPVRNYRLSRDRYGCAVSCAVRAEAASKVAFHASRESSRRDLDIARTLAAKVDTMLRAQILTPAGERQRRRAGGLVSDSESRFRQGDYPGASTRAREASSLLTEVIDRTRSRGARYLDPEVSRTWKRWVRETVAESRSTRSAAIVVVKESNRLDLYVSGTQVRSYPVDLGRNRLSRKLVAGDNATPEGRYRIEAKKGRGESRYHMALLLDYPNEADHRRLDQARRAGQIPPGSSPGRNIEIHGRGGKGTDWTEGCIALSNPDIEDLFGRITEGAPVTIIGSDGTSGSISRVLKAIHLERGRPR